MLPVRWSLPRLYSVPVCKYSGAYPGSLVKVAASPCDYMHFSLSRPDKPLLSRNSRVIQSHVPQRYDRTVPSRGIRRIDRLVWKKTWALHSPRHLADPDALLTLASIARSLLNRSRSLRPINSRYRHLDLGLSWLAGRSALIKPGTGCAPSGPDRCG